MTEETQSPEEQLSKLNKLYNEADGSDKATFAEFRSNVLLYIGTHYGQKELTGLRSFQTLEKNSAEKKLRLVKNHIGIICDRLMNATITSHSPDVTIEARNKSEVQDKKAADISNAIWHKIKSANRMPELISDFGFNFIVISEIIAFINFDTSKGRLIDFPIFDEMGAPVIDPNTGLQVTEKRFNGEVAIQNLEPFNVLSDPSAKSWDESEWIIYRKMVDVKALKEQYKGDPELVKKISKSSEESFTVFDAQRGSYGMSTKDKCLVKYIFYRPCAEYKEGYYFAYTNEALLEQGSLNNVWPLVYRPYQKVTTSRRAHGIIKRLRPCQAEINRIASTMAMTQLRHGTKLLIQNGSKISSGGFAGGSTAIKYSGAPPIIMQGESGERYLPLLQSQITELYQLANLSEEEEEKATGADSTTLLYRSLKDKKRFSQKSDIFESFLKEVCEVSLKTAKLFYTDSHLVQAVDKKDQINIDEFKNIEDFSVSIEVKPQSSDIESTMGMSLQIQHAIQYAQGMPPEQMATLVANMPYLKDTSMALEITADYRAVEDVFAAIERGYNIPVFEYDNHKYFIKKITNRLKETSFQFLPDDIKLMYIERLHEHERIEAENIAKIQRAQMGMIPAGGALIPVSIYMDENNASKRVRLPHDSIIWLTKKLGEQGSLQADLTTIANSETQGEMADMASAQFQQPQQTQPPQLNPQSGFKGPNA